MYVCLSTDLLDDCILYSECCTDLFDDCTLYCIVQCSDLSNFDDVNLL